MKRVLISGKGSYIGQSVKRYLEESCQGYQVEEVDVKDNNWRMLSFEDVDVVYHVAGIAHMKETEENKELYQTVNCDLAYELAKKAKEDGVPHFVFMSSMSVYGLNSYEGFIDTNTKMSPNTYYGKSKLEAERLISQLSSEKFKVALLRPPMVVGSGSPGNMGKLISLVKKIKVFPKYKNERSYITIETLISQVEQIIQFKKEGIMLLQENKYLCTSQYIREVMEKENSKVFGPKFFNPFIGLMKKRSTVFKKIFGDLKYKQINYFDK